MSRAQGEKVRELKSAKAAKPEVEAAVKALLELKSAFKAETGNFRGVYFPKKSFPPPFF